MNKLDDSPYKFCRFPSDQSLLELADIYKPKRLGSVEPELRAPPPRPNMWCPVERRHVGINTPFTSWHAIRGWVVFDKRDKIPRRTVFSNVVAFEWQSQIRFHRAIKPHHESDEYGVRDGADKIWYDKKMTVGTPVTVLVRPGKAEGSNEVYDPWGSITTNPSKVSEFDNVMFSHSEVIYGYFNETLYLTWSDLVEALREEDFNSEHRQSALDCLRYMLKELASNDPQTLVKALNQAKFPTTGSNITSLFNDSSKLVACAHNREFLFPETTSSPNIATFESLSPILNHLVLNAFGPS